MGSVSYTHVQFTLWLQYFRVCQKISLWLCMRCEVSTVLTTNIIVFEFVIHVCVLVGGYQLFAWTQYLHGKGTKDRGRMFHWNYTQPENHTAYNPVFIIQCRKYCMWCMSLCSRLHLYRLINLMQEVSVTEYINLRVKKWYEKRMKASMCLNCKMYKRKRNALDKIICVTVF